MDDLPDWHELNQAPGVTRYLSSTPPSREQTEAGLRRVVAAAALHHDYGFYTALQDDEFVGWFHLRPGSVETEGDIFNPELGYRLRPEYWGRRLATEGGDALVDHAFDQLGASSVYAETMAANAASRSVMAKLGMELETSFSWPFEDRVPGHEEGEVRYRITLDDWLENHQDPRVALHELQRTALAARDQSRLDALRRVGMELARAEADGVRCSDAWLVQTARRQGIDPYCPEPPKG